LKTLVTDYHKQIIDQRPYKVEVCKNVSGSGDKTGDTIGGAVIGGILGKALTGDDNAAGLGALFGGLLAHQNSQKDNSHIICKYETRYKETSKSVYSHSIVSFIYQGRQYRVKFKK